MTGNTWHIDELVTMPRSKSPELFVVSSHTCSPESFVLDEKLRKPHRLSFYFLVYRIEEQAIHDVDFDETTVHPGQLLFLMPQQIHAFTSTQPSGTWYYMAIQENALSQLTSSFPFLLNPFNRQLIDIAQDKEGRIKNCFQALDEIIHQEKQTGPGLVNSYLTTLLTELNLLYFSKRINEHSSKPGLPVFTQFRSIVNDKFRQHPSISSIAAELQVTENKLYSIVRARTGISPKEYLLNRIILEAKRSLFANGVTAKEISYQLGFDDPNYFFRLFKKYSGKSVSTFQRELKKFKSQN